MIVANAKYRIKIRKWEHSLIYVEEGYNKNLLPCYWNTMALEEIEKLKKKLI